MLLYWFHLYNCILRTNFIPYISLKSSVDLNDTLKIFRSSFDSHLNLFTASMALSLCDLKSATKSQGIKWNKTYESVSILLSKFYTYNLNLFFCISMHKTYFSMPNIILRIWNVLQNWIFMITIINIPVMWL